MPRLRAVKAPLAIFIDGVDEYFNKHVEALAVTPSVTGELSPNVWHWAQLGLVEVAYQLAPHQPSPEGVRGGAQGGLRAPAAADRHVPAVSGQRRRHRLLAASLREIFVNNIRLLKADRMIRPERLRTDPLAAFLGPIARHAHLHARGRGRLRATCAATRCSDRAI